MQVSILIGEFMRRAGGFKDQIEAKIILAK
jgi:hypothetical protein